VKFRSEAGSAPEVLHRVCLTRQTLMQVTEEDGGRLNAFAKEPRMVVMEQGEASDPSTRLLLIGGAALVAVLVAVAAGIS